MTIHCLSVPYHPFLQGTSRCVLSVQTRVHACGWNAERVKFASFSKLVTSATLASQHKRPDLRGSYLPLPDRNVSVQGAEQQTERRAEKLSSSDGAHFVRGARRRYDGRRASGVARGARHRLARGRRKLAAPPQHERQAARQSTPTYMWASEPGARKQEGGGGAVRSRHCVEPAPRARRGRDAATHEGVERGRAAAVRWRGRTLHARPCWAARPRPTCQKR